MTRALCHRNTCLPQNPRASLITASTDQVTITWLLFNPLRACRTELRDKSKYEGAKCYRGTRDVMEQTDQLPANFIHIFNFLKFMHDASVVRELSGAAHRRQLIEDSSLDNLGKA